MRVVPRSADRAARARGEQRRTRVLALLPLAALAVPVALVATGGSATAATGSISSPPSGAVYNSNAAIEIRATVSRGTLDSAEVRLTLTVPGETSARVVDTARDSDTSLAYTFSPACPDYPGSGGCTGRPAPNGDYVVAVTGSSANDSRRFTLQVAPAAPANVDAAATGQREVTVSWRSNTEPDLAGYELFERTGEGYAAVATGLPADTTSYVVTLPSSGYGGDHTYAVRARRKACPSCGETIPSPLAQSPTVTLNEPGSTPTPTPSESPGEGDGGYNGDPGPAPSPSDGGTGGGSGGTGGNGGNTGGGSGGTGGNGGNTGGSGNNGNGSGGQTDDNGYNVGDGGNGEFSSGGGKKSPSTLAFNRGMAFGLTFRDFAPKIGAPKLPPLPKTAPVPTPDGTFDPTLPYGEKVVTLPAETRVASAPREVMETFVSNVLDENRLYRSIAIALILLLAAGHLRMWLRAAARERY